MPGRLSPALHGRSAADGGTRVADGRDHGHGGISHLLMTSVNIYGGESRVLDTYVRPVGPMLGWCRYTRRI